MEIIIGICAIAFVILVIGALSAGKKFSNYDDSRTHDKF